ncbi:MAG: phosphatidylserine decarboxylase [Holosporaceae bacterium]|jgi:phosphatidylserine decarboxylase|nr:phosphatidylserine decarboxylase [Holosporaceae bacterium]
MDIRLPFDRDGSKIAAVVAVVAIFLGNLSTNMGWLGFILTISCLFFFRDPERVHPKGNSLIVSPADGTVLKVSECDPPDELGIQGKRKRISIFMSVFDVHVNRAPVSGRVEKILYVPGKFFNVTLDKASDFNERQATYIRAANNAQVIFVQIAGLVARRIRSDISEGQKLEMGQRVGIIRFGSRVDIYLPVDVEVSVEEGQVAVAGETILAHFGGKQAK